MHPSGPTLRRGYADGPAGQVHFYEGEGEGAPLLLLHQSPTSSTDWAATLPLFAAAGLRVIAVDNPGCGMSSAPPEPPTIADFADAALAVLDHLGVRRAHALGYHTGVQVALSAAARAPGRLGALALYGAPLMSADELKAHWERIVPRERDEGAQTPEPGGGHLKRLFEQVERFYGTEIAATMVTARLMAGPTLWYSHNAALSHDMTADFMAARHPLLLITHAGEMLDANTRAARALRPEAALAELGVTCAAAMYEAPDALAAAVVAFLKTPEAEAALQAGPAA